MNKRGFTLVELLIVVAIIGILSTVGIPTFKRMVQRSKRAEAKTMLSGLYTAEGGFQAEYGVYGNRLAKIGFEAGGVQNYTTGFPSAACADSAIAPSTATSQGSALNVVYPSYFETATLAYTSKIDAGAVRKPAACEVGTSAADGSTYVASATAAVNPSATLTDVTQMDRWTIDQNRNLVMTNDGVR